MPKRPLGKRRLGRRAQPGGHAAASESATGPGSKSSVIESCGRSARNSQRITRIGSRGETFTRLSTPWPRDRYCGHERDQRGARQAWFRRSSAWRRRRHRRPARPRCEVARRRSDRTWLLSEPRAGAALHARFADDRAARRRRRGGRQGRRCDRPRRRRTRGQRDDLSRRQGRRDGPLRAGRRRARGRRRRLGHLRLEAGFYAQAFVASHQYIFSMYKLSRTHPPDKQVLRDISLSFLPGAKIGVLGLNGAGKSTPLRIMAGSDTEYRGEAQLAPGGSVGLLEQEPHLDESKDVKGNVEDGVRELRDMLDRFNELAANYSD